MRNKHTNILGLVKNEGEVFPFYLYMCTTFYPLSIGIFPDPGVVVHMWMGLPTAPDFVNLLPSCKTTKSCVMLSWILQIVRGGGVPLVTDLSHFLIHPSSPIDHGPWSVWGNSHVSQWASVRRGNRALLTEEGEGVIYPLPRCRPLIYRALTSCGSTTLVIKFPGTGKGEMKARKICDHCACTSLDLAHQKCIYFFWYD